MKAQLERLKGLLTSKEGEHVEFKEAKQNYHFEKLVKYCCALANERGGVMVLGVTDKRPRKVVGTRTFPDLERTKAGLLERLHFRVDAEEVLHPDGRVVIFDVPPRPLGMPLHYEGAYWMRAGEDLAPMTPDMLKRIFAESGPDFSSEPCPGASIADLDRQAITLLKAAWARKSGNSAVAYLPDEQLLRDLELSTDRSVNYAALVLLGTSEGLGRHLPQAELIFEYRSTDTSTTFQQRKEFRQGFFLFDRALWDLINLRNEVQHFQQGFFMWDIPTFNETVVREAVLNAICHREYRLGESIFVRQFPRKLEVVSPGGFPAGITPENILWRQSPRNRRIAEVLAKCGFVERSGQGANRMFEECIRESKPRPDYSGTDDYQVFLALYGEVQNPRFLQFLELVNKERLVPFGTEDLLALDIVHRGEIVPVELRGRLYRLREVGLVETVGRGRAMRFTLSRRFYGFLGEKGAYTRKRGLPRETHKALLLEHINRCKREGSRFEELHQVLPELSRDQVRVLLRELRGKGKIRAEGRTRAARWYPVPD